jgi:pimeloyl-ACP methyl ester carboxylesterase
MLPMVPKYQDKAINVLGARMHVLRAGDGPPLLLVHGLVGAAANWKKSIDALAPHASIYAIDQLNMGKSQRVDSLDASLEATADRLAAAMDALNLTQADIAGHSHGGAVALMLAARHQERVRRLILFAPANPYSHPADRLVRIFSTRIGRLVAKIGPNLPARLQQAGLNRVYGDPSRIPDGCLQGYIEDLRVPGTMQHILTIVQGWFANMARLERVLPLVADVPTLLLWGDRDCAVELRSATQLQRILRRSELHVIRGGGHVLFEEFPEESNRIVLDWLRRDPGHCPIIASDEPARVRAPRRSSIPTHGSVQPLTHGT